MRKSAHAPQVHGEDIQQLDLTSGKTLVASVREVLRASQVREKEATVRNYVLRLEGDVYAFVRLDERSLQVFVSRFYDPGEEAFSRSIAPGYDAPETFSDYSSASDLDSPRSEMF